MFVGKAKYKAGKNGVSEVLFSTVGSSLTRKD
jgi:hypothetical protein